MVTAIEPILRQQLIDRRQKLQFARNSSRDSMNLSRLLQEVDAALDRMEEGTYGLCDYCHDPVETERLLANPLTRLCIDHLSPVEQRALEADLELAASIQNGLLPQPSLNVDGWEVAYHYEPAGLVSGDYCDLITREDGCLHFVLGDVSGKGVAASMLMAHLHAMFRTLVSVRLPLGQVLERASRVFCESTLPTHYATLVCGNLDANGSIELSNAGHLPPLLVQQGQVRTIDATGLPIGMFSTEEFTVERFEMNKGDTLFLYTDGVSEMVDGTGAEYGIQGLKEVLSTNYHLSPKQMIETCLRELHAANSVDAPGDDLTMMAIQRVH